MINILLGRVRYLNIRAFSTKSKREQTLEQLENQGLFDKISTQTIRLDRQSMTPHQYWIAKGRGMERPFTGEYWFNQEVGSYKCRVCKNALFSFDDKFKSETGMASFWNHQRNSLELADIVEEDKQNDSRHVCCAQCKCQVGKVFFDGPPPTFIRYEINSSALQFELKPFFQDPTDIAEQKRERRKQKKIASRRDFLKEFNDSQESDDIIKK